MVISIFYHEECFLHETGPDHPERPSRLSEVMRSLEALGNICRWYRAPLASDEDLGRVHSARHIERIWLAASKGQLWNVDPDTTVTSGSIAASRRAAGAVCGAIEAVYSGPNTSAFCAVRPPGHHAEHDLPMGFCLFNNLAVGAAYAREKFGCRRVAIVDIDGHHGNGAQNIFWNDSDAFVSSIHEWPSDISTGAGDERGCSGQILNITLPWGADSHAFQAAIKAQLLPRLRAHNPDLILVAAGFDGHYADSLTHLAFDIDVFNWVGTQLQGVANNCCEGRLVASLEGGYNLQVLGHSVAAFVSGMAEAAKAHRLTQKMSPHA